jgi:ABC-type multidrug transport system fused ATPase/permease subunit
MRGRTTFMIAHRLNTLNNCDLILVLEQGRLVEVRGRVPETLAATAAAT